MREYTRDDRVVVVHVEIEITNKLVLRMFKLNLIGTVKCLPMCDLREEIS